MKGDKILAHIKSHLSNELNKNQEETKKSIVKAQITLINCILNNQPFNLPDKEFMVSIISSPYTQMGYGSMLFDSILLLHCESRGTENDYMVNSMRPCVLINPFLDTISIIENGVFQTNEATTDSFLTLLRLLNLSWKNRFIETLLLRCKSSKLNEIDDVITGLKDQNTMDESIDLESHTGIILYILYLQKQQFPELNLTKEAICKEVVLSNYKHTFGILSFLMSEQFTSDLLFLVYDGIFRKNKLVSIFESIVNELQTVLSEDIIDVLKDVYSYETQKLKLISQSGISNLFEIESELDNYKYKVFSKFDLNLPDEFMVSPIAETIQTQFKWHFDAGQDYEIQSGLTNITEVHKDPIILHRLISSLSSSGYYEYEVNKYQQLIFEIFLKPKTLQTAFDHFFDRVNDAGSTENNASLQEIISFEFMKLVRVLVDRNIIIPKEYSSLI